MRPWGSRWATRSDSLSARLQANTRDKANEKHEINHATKQTKAAKTSGATLHTAQQHNTSEQQLHTHTHTHPHVLC